MLRVMRSPNVTCPREPVSASTPPGPSLPAELCGGRNRSSALQPERLENDSPGHRPGFVVEKGPCPERAQQIQGKRINPQLSQGVALGCAVQPVPGSRAGDRLRRFVFAAVCLSLRLGVIGNNKLSVWLRLPESDAPARTRAAPSS